MMRVEEALKNILDTIHPLGLEKVNILDALGRVIGEDIISSRTIPPKDNSAMDGYAVRAEDTGGASESKPVFLRVVESIPAGAIPEQRINRGQAARIMTGAPVPEGADSVIRMEDARKDGEQRVAIVVEAKKGQDIRLAGEDVRQGEKVICRGSAIRPAEAGMLASLGRSFVFVNQRPLVAILATGDELTDIDENISPWKIVNSNSYSLAALVIDSGAIPIQLGIARDRRDDLIEKLGAARRADLIISSGGVSVGDFDLVKDVMKEEGNRMQFWRVMMKPGRPLAFGMLGGTPFIGLPGNPVSAMVSFEQFVRPAIRKMIGHSGLFRRTVKARLCEEISKKPGIRHFIRAIVRRDGDIYSATTTGDQGSGILKSMVMANGLIILPEDAAAARAGDVVTVQLLNDSLDWAKESGY